VKRSMASEHARGWSRLPAARKRPASLGQRAQTFFVVVRAAFVPNVREWEVGTGRAVFHAQQGV